MARKSRKKAASPNGNTDHALVGKNVSFRSRIWRVVSVNSKGGDGLPWLNLRRGLQEASCKPDEITPVFD